MKSFIILIIGVLLLALLMYVATTMFDNAPAQKQPETITTEKTENMGESESVTEAVTNPITHTSIQEFSVTDASGATVKSIELIGKPMILHFWASWYEVNLNELPALQTMYEKYGDEVEFVIVCITDGEYETLESAQKYLADKGYTFPIYFDTLSEALHAYQLYTFANVPRTYLYNEQGTYVSKANITLNEEMLEDGIAMILPTKNVEE